MTIKSTTWTKESHGLFDFEGTEIEIKNFKVEGNLRLSRYSSDVQITQLENGNFFEMEKAMDEADKEAIVARVLNFNGNYWIYHKAYVDSTIDRVSETKPEEKIWRVVKEIHINEPESPAYRLNKRDLIKVGRVRFKIREIMSPIYAQIEKCANDE